MRISDWSSDVCSSDLAVLDHLIDARGVGQLVSGRKIPQRRQKGHAIAAANALREVRHHFGAPHLREPGRCGNGADRHAEEWCEHADARVQRLVRRVPDRVRSEEHTSELPSLMRISYAVFSLKKKKKQ